MKPGDLLKHIRRFVVSCNEEAIDSKKHPICAEDEAFLASSLTVFVESATRKFIAGQNEHGGHITDRALLTEIDNELIDLFWYSRAVREKVKKL